MGLVGPGKNLEFGDMMKLEEPLKDLVLLLRDKGFNTYCSCSHLPHPYIQMEWYCDEDVTKLYKLLVENHYKKFIIKARWDINLNSRVLEVVFHYIKMPLAKKEDVQETKEKKKETTNVS